MTDNDALLFLLRQLNTQDVGHSGRSLFDHLFGTCTLLKQWGNEKHVCLAGLYHSIYGTQHFKPKSFSLSKREVIQDLIGKEAERLVYIFCVTRRPRAFLDARRALRQDETELFDFNAGLEIRIKRQDLNELLEIEAANLLEQKGARVDMMQEIASADVSAGAKDAIRNYVLNPYNGGTQPARFTLNQLRRTRGEFWKGIVRSLASGSG